MARLSRASTWGEGCDEVTAEERLAFWLVHLSVTTPLPIKVFEPLVDAARAAEREIWEQRIIQENNETRRASYESWRVSHDEWRALAVELATLVNEAIGTYDSGENTVANGRRAIARRLLANPKLREAMEATK